MVAQLSLLVIGSAGFGREVSWSKSKSKHRLEEKELGLDPQPLTRMTFLQSLHIVSDNLLLKLFLNQMPSWVPTRLIDILVDFIRAGAGGTRCTQVRKAFIEFEVSIQMLWMIIQGLRFYS